MEKRESLEHTHAGRRDVQALVTRGEPGVWGAAEATIAEQRGGPSMRLSMGPKVRLETWVPRVPGRRGPAWQLAASVSQRYSEPGESAGWEHSQHRQNQRSWVVV